VERCLGFVLCDVVVDLTKPVLGLNGPFYFRHASIRRPMSSWLITRPPRDDDHSGATLGLDELAEVARHGPGIMRDENPPVASGEGQDLTIRQSLELAATDSLPVQHVARAPQVIRVTPRTRCDVSQNPS
jgi:hypothetical protein